MYKVGDKVKLRSDLKPDRMYGNLTWWRGKMADSLSGKIVTIESNMCPDETYYVTGGWYINEQMIDHSFSNVDVPVKIPKPTFKYKKGRRITSLDDMYHQEFVMWNGKVYHKGWTHAWQIRMVANAIYSTAGMWVAVKTEVK